MWHDGVWSTGAWVGMTLMMVLFWGGLIAVVVWLARGKAVGSPRVTGDIASTSADTPEAVLANRFARGEIDEDEFLHRLELLRGTGDRAT